MEIQEINQMVPSFVNALNLPLSMKAEAQTIASDRSGNRALMRMMQHSTLAQSNLQSLDVEAGKSDLLVQEVVTDFPNPAVMYELVDLIQSLDVEKRPDLLAQDVDIDFRNPAVMYAFAELIRWLLQAFMGMERFPLCYELPIRTTR